MVTWISCAWCAELIPDDPDFFGETLKRFTWKEKTYNLHQICLKPFKAWQTWSPDCKRE